MTKFTYIFVLTIFISSSALAQSLSRTNMGSAGTSSSTAQLEVNYSLGQLRVESVSGSGLLITEGFQQGYAPSDIDTGDGGGETTIMENTSIIEFTAHPNPATQQITVLGKNVSENLELRCYSSLGQFITSKTMTERGEVVFNVSNLAAGYYTIEVRDETNQVVNQLKFQKL